MWRLVLSLLIWVMNSVLNFPLEHIEFFPSYFLVLVDFPTRQEKGSVDLPESWSKHMKVRHFMYFFHVVYSKLIFPFGVGDPVTGIEPKKQIAVVSAGVWIFIRHKFYGGARDPFWWTDGTWVVLIIVWMHMYPLRL